MRPLPLVRGTDEGPDPSDLKGEPRAALALAGGATIIDAAKAAGISARTVRRRLQRVEYRMEISRLRGQLLDAAVGKLAAATADAVDTLVQLLGAASEHVKLGAAKAIVELGLSLAEAVEVQGRITTLEELIVTRRQEVRVWGKDLNA
jgi:hypothetical protein